MKRYCIIEFDTILYHTWFSKTLNPTKYEIVSHDMTSFFFLLRYNLIFLDPRNPLSYTLHPEGSNYIQLHFPITEKVLNWWQQIFITADIKKIRFA